MNWDLKHAELAETAYTLLQPNREHREDGQSSCRGAKSLASVNVELKYFARPEDLAEADGIILGMPTYHHDISVNMKRFLEECRKLGKTVAERVAKASLSP